MKPLLTHILTRAFLMLLPCAGIAQPAMEFANGSGPATTGSVLTNQAITFKNNALNPTTGTYTTLVPTTTATFSISNQQYTLPASQNPNGSVLSFGANVNGSGKIPTSMSTFSAMNTVSAAPNADFSATQYNVGAGISTSSNYAVELFTSSMGLYNANSPTNGTYYIANLTITFNLPVTDPVIQIVGLGGTFGALGLTSELSLITPGVTMSELSGSSEFSVLMSSILNTSANPAATTGAGAASGSVLITGTVSSLTFQIFLHGNGKTPTWSNANEHTGDAWMIGVSAINTYTALPVNTTSFTAEAQNRAVALQWTTATETNSKYFDVQRSADGVNWTNIGQLPAAGNSDNTRQYGFTDLEPEQGANYYRFQLVSDNDAQLYSTIKEVNFSSSSLAISWYPNPVRDRLTITSGDAIKSVTLTTLSGQTLQTAGGFTSGQSIDFSRYPFGIYIVIIRTTSGQTRVARIERSL
jgi:Secretion system C-terminal sorting domain